MSYTNEGENYRKYGIVIIESYNKTIGSKVYTYTYDSNLLIKEQITDTTNDIDVTLEYIYDESKQVVGVVEGNNVYYYDKKL